MLKNMEYQKRRFLKQDRNREKNKNIKEILKTTGLDEDEDEDENENEDYTSNSSASIQKPLKFLKISTGRARAKITKKKLIK